MALLDKKWSLSIFITWLLILVYFSSLVTKFLERTLVKSIYSNGTNVGDLSAFKWTIWSLWNR